MHRDVSDRSSDGSLSHRRRPDLILAIVCTLALLVLAACGGKAAPAAKVAPRDRDALIQQAALQYARDGSLSKAQETLSKLNLANPAQFVVTLAEQAINDGKPADEIAALARLAAALGGRSPRVVAYLAPAATPTALSRPTNTVVPADPTATPPPPTATAVPPTVAPTVTPTAAVTATALPQKPRVVADSTANLRGGPGTIYPMIGQMTPGKEVDIIGRNASGDWWRIAWDGAGQAWVAGLVVRVLGPIDTVAVAKDIPAPPPTNTPAPPPAPTAPPKPAGPDFQLVSVRLWGVEENGGYFDGPSLHCGGGRVLHAIVLDAKGNRLNGVTVKAALGAQEEIVSGNKGPGVAEFVLGGGQELYVVRDVDGRTVTSDYARGMTTDTRAIPFDVLKGSGYCKTDTDCAHLHAEYACKGHYSWDVTFKRSY